ncbi:hypothetical protein RchiOBHm_Chr4g0437931 [Rosa chinensis]|uniref:Uncharacterized protein n=1 Tax=Rosa chinensis TaxID=74649 RepID=A0A2P6R2F3_ROSCH|nr:hypothetical protein RchiOBHm_Chr4g0437931 [Rosa chinensis]
MAPSFVPVDNSHIYTSPSQVPQIPRPAEAPMTAATAPPIYHRAPVIEHSYRFLLQKGYKPFA